MQEVFLKVLQNMKPLETLDIKRDCETYTKKEILSLKLNLWSTTYKMNFIP